MDDNTTILPKIMDAARTAGEAIMGYYKTGSIIYKKEDSTPVTEADRVADKIISDRLRTITPDYPVVSEEGDKPDVSHSQCFWLVDPLDGTKSFIRSSGYFTVNIGLIKNKTPVLGVIYDPVNRVMYYGSTNGAFREHNGVTEQIHARTQSPMVALVSHSHINEATQKYLEEHQISKNIPCASSIKFCFLAEGKADIYPRFGQTMEWDTAAGHAILLAAGGAVNTPEGVPLLYGKEGFLNGYFIASN